MSTSTSSIKPGRFPMVPITWAGLTRPVHEGIVEQFHAVIRGWEARGGQSAYHIDSWWGYAPRPNNAGAHPRGVGIDANPADNPMVAKRGPCPTNMPGWFVDLWKSQGFGWGGDWRSKCDAMHFSKLPDEGGNGLIYESPVAVQATSQPTPTFQEDDMTTLTLAPGAHVFWAIDGLGLNNDNRFTWLSLIARDASVEAHVALGNARRGGPGIITISNTTRWATEVQRDDDRLFVSNRGKTDLGLSLVSNPR